MSAQVTTGGCGVAGSQAALPGCFLVRAHFMMGGQLPGGPGKEA